jgi:hypothetical protein
MIRVHANRVVALVADQLIGRNWATVDFVRNPVGQIVLRCFVSERSIATSHTGGPFPAPSLGIDLKLDHEFIENWFARPSHWNPPKIKGNSIMKRVKRESR